MAPFDLSHFMNYDYDYIYIYVYIAQFQFIQRSLPLTLQ